MYTHDIMRVKHYYKNGDDVDDLLEGYWGSPAFLGLHFENGCFI